MGDARNANAVHWMRTGHSMDWKGVTVVDRASKWREWRVKESVHTRTRRTYNLDLGFLESSVELADYASRGVNNFQLSDWSA